MAQSSFQLDSSTAQAIDELKEAFGVTTSTAVIRRAVALARFAARNASTDGSVTLLDKDDKRTKVLLAS